MRMTLCALASLGLLLGSSCLVRADEGTKVTVSGYAQCAKCALAETAKCQNVVVSTKDGKELKYYLAENEVSKSAHNKLGFCSAKKGEGPMVQVVGLCKKDGEKLVVTAEKIEACPEEPAK